jgi:hypothetical protein
VEVKLKQLVAVVRPVLSVYKAAGWGAGVTFQALAIPEP